MAQKAGRTLTARFERWLDHLFFGGVEVCVLASPVLALLLAAPHPSATSLAGLSAVCAASVGVALYRGEYVAVGRWPRGWNPFSIPFRAAYYGGVVAGGTFAGVRALLLFEVWWLGVLVPALVCLPALAGVPRLHEWIQKTARRG